ncbi:putative Acid phosphatase [Rosa chinensis]|uniref:Purple acid phosphatase n=1 Tax=Rosa chinensis TaxID=74649 RepID=A0A2P6RGV4_ROSCH|nr:putative Acid phosphatase [Rosa chinensis]
MQNPLPNPNSWEESFGNGDEGFVHISLARDKHMWVTWVTGDRSAPSIVEYGTSSGKYGSPRWDTFGELVQPLASARPWMVTQGNHEKDSIPFLKDGFESYNSRRKMPYKESGSSSNLYYSFELAGAHIIMLGSYIDYDKYLDQYKWLKVSCFFFLVRRNPIYLLH